MEDYPKTMLEFNKRFNTEHSCQEYLYKMRWPEGFICPHCQHREYWMMKRGQSQQYRCKRCRSWISATAGTIFHELRIAMVRPGRDRLVGPVQVDETYIGGPRPGRRGRGAANKTLVIVAVEDKGKRLGRIRLHKVKDASGESLIPAVKESVQPKSEVLTDDWNGYSKLSYYGYKHTIIRKTADVGENLLPLTNRVVSLLKRWLQGTHQGAPRPSYLDYYLDEFVFRFNRRTSRSRGLLFYRLVQQAVNIAPVTAHDIRGDK